MEGKTHSSKSYAVAGAVSRMASDLAECSKGFQASFEPRQPIRERAAPETPKAPTVCVVGAGLAGLRCAQILMRGGLDVTIFEARDRVGGRVCQERLGGRLVDMGPNWVHGTDSNPIVRLAAETKTRISSLGEESVYLGSDGKPVDDDKIGQLDETIWEIIGEAFAYSNKSCAEIRAELSLKDWFEEKLPQRGLSAEDNSLGMQMAQLWGSFIGDSWEKQSLKWFWLEECLDGENLFVVDSHKNIVDNISQGLETRVQLRTQVERIESQGNETGDPFIRVTAVHEGTPQTRTFDEVVVAIPMGCLKRDHIEFTPPLPNDTQQAIANASISSLEKVYLAFPSAFWDSPASANETDGEAAEPMPGFANFLNPVRCAPDEHHSWCLELNPLSNIEDFGGYAQPALLFSLFGECGNQLTASITGLSPGSQRYLDIVNDFLKPYYSRLPNYSADNPACSPTAILATNWQNDEYAYGSYTNFKVHSPEQKVDLDRDVRIMRHGMPERGIWLAGEHVAPFVGLGTSTGAYWSGEMAAMRVLAANGLAGKVAGEAGIEQP